MGSIWRHTMNQRTEQCKCHSSWAPVSIPKIQEPALVRARRPTKYLQESSGRSRQSSKCKSACACGEGF